MDGTTLVGVIVALVLQTLLGALAIWIVSKLNVGLSVNGFGGAILAAIVIAVLTTMISFLLASVLVTTGMALGLWSGIVGLIVAVVVLLLSDKILPSLKVNGFVGAVAAAVTIAANLGLWIGTMKLTGGLAELTVTTVVIIVGLIHLFREFPVPAAVSVAKGTASRVG